MIENKLTEDSLDSYLCDAFAELRPYYELHHPELVKEMEQAYNQLKKMIENYDEVQAFAMEIIESKTVTLAEITELSARLRDTSRQSLYETKLKRWLESKGMEVVDG